MAYQSATSTAPNQPRLLTQGIGVGQGGSTAGSTSIVASLRSAVWNYVSTHVQTDVSSTGFFTDGRNLGMRLGDVVMVYGSTTFIQSQHVVNVVTSTGVGLTSGLIVSSAS